MRAARYLADTGGAAAVEFAMTLSFLVVPVMALIDIGTYTYTKMQVEHAAQVGAQYVWATCNTPSRLPVTRYCPITDANVLAAAQAGTQLGSTITASSSGYVLREFYACLNTSTNTPSIQNSGTTYTFSNPIGAEASSCSSPTSGSPMDYVVITVNSTYRPVFGSLSVANLLGTTLTKTSQIRVF
jgi:Flp pilus assembly protein TadG